MSTPVLLITEVTPKPGTAARSVARAWRALPDSGAVSERRIYVALDDGAVLELAALETLDAAAMLTTSWLAAWDRLGQGLASDFRRQLLTFVEAPKDTAAALPPTPYVQLRHVEVPPSNFADYRAWRERTIFDVVRGAPEVESFLAYHSAISTEPGVMFISGFSGDVDRYCAVFGSTRYQQIVQEAGDRFITGGKNGLYTRIYRQVACE